MADEKKECEPLLLAAEESPAQRRHSVITHQSAVAHNEKHEGRMFLDHLPQIRL